MLTIQIIRPGSLKRVEVPEVDVHDVITYQKCELPKCDRLVLFPRRFCMSLCEVAHNAEARDRKEGRI